MTLSLLVMAALGALALFVGVPMLLQPALVRRRWGLKDTPQLAYILRIVGAMFTALGLTLFTFAATYWRALRP
jgi:hypothetical protein